MALEALSGIKNLVENLFQLNNISSPNGSVVSFAYRFYRHDPYPVILTAGFDPYHGLIEGLNLHYMSFPIFRALLQNHAGNPGFNYFLIKSQPMITQAFRSYKINGILNAKKVNWKAIIDAMSIIRQYSPQEMLAIRQAVDQAAMSRTPEILNELVGGLIQNTAAQMIQTQAPIQPQQTQLSTEPQAPGEIEI